ncbi:MAG: holo-ACP synthase [Chloroflexi bacterium]|nr:holo-ACP synthase [Chloroflexota bacterium]
MLQVGVDIVEIERIERALRRYGDRFRRRIYTPRELAESGGRGQSLAARFAAKEAAIKALGDSRMAFHEIEVLRPGGGRPLLRLSGHAAERATALGVEEMAVSLSHCQQYAVATVVIRHAADSER